MTAPTAVCSDRKRAANQANARKSTGPRTAEGKAKVRLNALVHGLRAETVVLPHEDASAFEAIRQGWIEDWNPQTEARLALVERAVAGVWRLRRCVKVEHDRLARQMNEAVAAYDGRVAARLNEGLRLLALDPPQGLAELQQEHAGVAALIARWELLQRSVADAHRWSTLSHHTSLLNLLGFAADAHADEVGPAGVESWRLMVWNHPELGKSEVVDEAHAQEIALALTDFMDQHLAYLKSRLTQFLDPDRVRARIADSVAFDVSREGVALQRYEAQLDRAFRANLNQLIKLAQTGADLIEAETAEPSEAPIKPTEPKSNAPIKPTEPPTESPIKPTEVTSEPHSPNKATKIDPFEGHDTLRLATTHHQSNPEVSIGAS